MSKTEELLRANFDGDVKQIESSEKLGIKAVVSSLSIDREGEVVDISTAEFRRTKTGELDVPVLLDHNYGTREIIGKVTGYDYSLDGELIFDMEFASFKKDAVETYMLLAGGYLKNAFSIGFFSNRDGSVLRNPLIHEVSVVVLPANQDARVIDVLKELSTVSEVVEATKSLRKDIIVADVTKDVADEAKEEVAASEVVTEDAATEQVVEQTVEADVKEVGTVEEVAEEAEIKETKEEKSMSDFTKEDVKAMLSEALADQAKALEVANIKSARADDEVEVEKVEVKEKFDYKLHTIKTVLALKNGQKSELTNLNKVSATTWSEADHAVKDVITGVDMGNDALICYDVYRDIQACEAEVGALANLVTRVQLTRGDGMKFPSKSGILNLTAIENCARKPEAGKVTITAEQVRLSKFAGVSIWCDIDAEDNVVGYYQLLLNELVRADLRNIDEVVLSYDGDRGTGANPEYASGILVNPDVNTVAVNYADIATGVLDAECGTDCPLDRAILVMNKCTYSELLKIWNTSCNSSCASTANQTDFGGVKFREIFGYPVVIVNSKDRNGDYFVPTGTVIMGDFSQYVLMEKGSFNIDQSNHTVELDNGDIVYTWQYDMTAVRAYVRRGGYLLNPQAFTIFQCS